MAKKQAYFIEYLRTYWTDFRNISPYESTFRADDGSVPHFPICRIMLPQWRQTHTTCILCTFARWSTVLVCYYLLGGDTAAPSGLYVRLCRTFLVLFSPLGKLAGGLSILPMFFSLFFKFFLMVDFLANVAQTLMEQSSPKFQDW